MFALVTAEISRQDDDVEAGLVEAVRWIGAELPLYALNLVLSTATDLWLLRYPATHELHLLQRPAGGNGTSRHLEGRTGWISTRAEALAGRPAVLGASEPLDDDTGWRALGAGELVHVGPDLTCSTSTPFEAPRYQLMLSDLDARTAGSQHPA